MNRRSFLLPGATYLGVVSAARMVITCMREIDFDSHEFRFRVPEKSVNVAWNFILFIVRTGAAA